MEIFNKHSQILRRFFAWTFIAIVMPASAAQAEVTLIDTSAGWLFYTQRGVGAEYAACQVVSCPRGSCGSSSRGLPQFSLYDARDGRGAFPEFIAPRRVPPGATSLLDVGGKKYRLRNTFPSPQFYMFVEKTEVAKEVLNSLVALENADGNAEFSVTDPFGSRHDFAVRGITNSLNRMVRRCSSVP